MHLIKNTLALSLVAAMSVMTIGCASQPKSQASMLMDERRTYVFTGHDVETKKGYPDSAAGTIVLGTIGFLSGGIDDALFLGAMNEQREKAEGDRHHVFTYISRDKASTPADFIEQIDTGYSEAIEKTIQAQGFAVTKKEQVVVEPDSSRYEQGVARRWDIVSEEVGCPADVSPRKRCAVMMSTGTRVSDFSREGFLSQDANGGGYPYIVIRSPIDGPYDQSQFYVELSKKLPADSYLYLARDQKVWIGDQQVFNHNLIVHDGELLDFQTPIAQAETAK